MYICKIKIKIKIMQKKTHLFCPNKNCPHYGELNHTIICYGTYSTKNDNIARQQF